MVCNEDSCNNNDEIDDTCVGRWGERPAPTRCSRPWRDKGAIAWRLGPDCCLCSALQACLSSWSLPPLELLVGSFFPRLLLVPEQAKVLRSATRLKQTELWWLYRGIEAQGSVLRRVALQQRKCRLGNRFLRCSIETRESLLWPAEFNPTGDFRLCHGELRGFNFCAGQGLYSVGLGFACNYSPQATRLR